MLWPNIAFAPETWISIALMTPLLWPVTATAGLVGVAVALLAGLLAGLSWPVLVRRASEPVLPDGEPKVPYANLATRRHQVAAALWVTGLTIPASVLLPAAQLAPWLVLAFVGGLAATVDIATTWIPRGWLHGGWLAMAVAVIASGIGAGDYAGILRAAVGSAIAGGLFWLLYGVALWRGTVMFGFADVRLAFLSGAVAGWWGWGAIGTSLFVGAFVGAVWGFVTALKRRRNGAFPYAPSIVIGPPLALLLSWLLGG